MAGARPVILWLALSGALTGCASVPSTDRDHEEFAERLMQVYENTPESERQAFEAKMNELDVFVRHLRCEGATQVPAPDHIKGMAFVRLPLQESFTVAYPLGMQVHIESNDPSRAKVYVAARQQASEAPWEITEIWTESAKDMKKDLGLPSAEIQQRINRDLPRLIRDGEQATNRWLWPACALAGR